MVFDKLGEQENRMGTVGTRAGNNKGRMENHASPELDTGIWKWKHFHY